jgi:type IV pilus assembly protein PilV
MLRSRVSAAGRGRLGGSSLIAVLVAILLLSVSAIAIGAMIMFAVQMPKLAGYRASATNLAAGYIERMRANRVGFELGRYQLKGSSYHNDARKLRLSDIPGGHCDYPDCSASAIADMDFAEVSVALREALPAGGLLLLTDPDDGTCGNLWILWNEPATVSFIDGRESDQCPAQIRTEGSDQLRCLYLRFQI